MQERKVINAQPKHKEKNPSLSIKKEPSAASRRSQEEEEDKEEKEEKEEKDKNMKKWWRDKHEKSAHLNQDIL